MYTLEEFRDTVLGMQQEYAGRLPLAVWEEIAEPWFEEIFPVKNEMYGVDGLQRLGPSHAVAEFAGCFYRWHRMDQMEFSASDAAMMNAIHDAFGYSVIMRAMADCEVEWKTADKTKAPIKDIQQLLDFYWDDRLPVDSAAVTMATRCSINMYRRTAGA